MKFLKKLDFSDRDLGQYKLFFVPSNHSRLVLTCSELATCKKLCINYTAVPSQTHTLKIQSMAYQIFFVVFFFRIIIAKKKRLTSYTIMIVWSSRMTRKGNKEVSTYAPENQLKLHKTASVVSLEWFLTKLLCISMSFVPFLCINYDNKSDLNQ